jgi:hypothetical protein
MEMELPLDLDLDGLLGDALEAGAVDGGDGDGDDEVAGPETPPETPKLPSQHSLELDAAAEVAAAVAAAADAAEAAEAAAAAAARAAAAAQPDEKAAATAAPSEMMVAAVQLLRQAAGSGTQIPAEFYDCITCEVMVVGPARYCWPRPPIELLELSYPPRHLTYRHVI